MADFDENPEVFILQQTENNYLIIFPQIFQVTDEEKLQIAQHYLLSSPPGQFQEVLTG